MGRLSKQGQRAHDIAIELDDTALQVRVSLSEGALYYVLGDHRRAMACLQPLIVSFEEHPPLAQQSRLLGPYTLYARSWYLACLGSLGMFAEGLRIGQEAVHMSAATNRPFEHDLWEFFYRMDTSTQGGIPTNYRGLRTLPIALLSAGKPQHLFSLERSVARICIRSIRSYS